VTAPRFRLRTGVPTVTISVDGVALPAPAGRSLLAALLIAGRPGAAADFACGIGQCQRCLVRVNAAAELACMVYPRGGEQVETSIADGRPPPWELPPVEGA